MSGAAHARSAGHTVGGSRYVGARLMEQDVRRDAEPPMQAPSHRQGERALAGVLARSMAAERRFEVLETQPPCSLRNLMASMGSGGMGPEKPRP